MTVHNRDAHVFGGARGQTWSSPVSRWLRGSSQPWPSCHNYQLSSVREMTHSLFNKSWHPDRQACIRTDGRTDGRGAWRTLREPGRKTRDTAREYFNSPLNLGTQRLAPNGWKQEKAVGVIGPRQRRSGVNGLIWGLTPFKTNLRLCVFVPLTKFLTRSVLRFIVLLKGTCCPAKGHLMVFQTHRITLMYCRSKDKMGALAHTLEKMKYRQEKKKKFLSLVYTGSSCSKR